MTLFFVSIDIVTIIIIISHVHLLWAGPSYRDVYPFGIIIYIVQTEGAEIRHNAIFTLQNIRSHSLRGTGTKVAGQPQMLGAPGTDAGASIHSYGANA